jgi:hypothetical protein
MLSAIDLDDELRLGAKEIDDIGSKRMLAAFGNLRAAFRAGATIA